MKPCPFCGKNAAVVRGLNLDFAIQACKAGYAAAGAGIPWDEVEQEIVERFTEPRTRSSSGSGGSDEDPSS